METPGSAWLTLCGWGILTLGGVWIALRFTEPLRPGTPFFYAVPPLLAGVYIAVSATAIRDSGVYGTVLGWLPPLGHAVFQGVGCGVAGLGVWMGLSLPPAGAARIANALPALENRCVGEPSERLERDVLPRVRGLLRDRPAQSERLKAELDATLRRLLARCAVQARVAFADPRGTHASWDKLRGFLTEHPELHDLDASDPLFGMAARPRQRPISQRPVPLILE